MQRVATLKRAGKLESVPVGVVDDAPVDARSMYELTRLVFEEGKYEGRPILMTSEELEAMGGLEAVFGVDVPAGERNPLRGKVRTDVFSRHWRKWERSVATANPPIPASAWLRDIEERLFGADGQGGQRRELRNLNDGADWRVLAVLVEEQDGSRVAMASASGIKLGKESDVEKETWPESGVPLPVATIGRVLAEEKARQMKVTVVWIDASQQGLQDPNVKHGEYNGTETPIGRYVESGLLIDMPLAFRREREEAKRVVDLLRKVESEPAVRAPSKLESLPVDEVKHMVNGLPLATVAGLLGVTPEEVAAYVKTTKKPEKGKGGVE